MKYLHMRLPELLEARGISRTRLCKDLDLQRTNLNLVIETARKAADADHPRTVQTGPAVRGDRAVAERHERMLEGDPRAKEIYRLLTDYIWETSKKI